MLRCSKDAAFLVLMICCRSSPCTPQEFGERSQVQIPEYRATDRSLTIIWASALGRCAADGADTSTSHFMRGFLRSIERPAQLKEMFNHISKCVQNSRLNQKPWFSSNSTSSGSDFFLPEVFLRTGLAEEPGASSPTLDFNLQNVLLGSLLGGPPPPGEPNAKGPPQMLPAACSFFSLFRWQSLYVVQMFCLPDPFCC